MASIKDAIEDSFNDDLSVVKYILYATPIFISYLLFNKGNMGWFYFIGFLTAIMLLTLLVTTLHNVRNGKNYVLPKFNVFAFGLAAFKLSLAILPLWGICIWAGKALCGIQIPIPLQNIQLIYSIIVWILLGSIMITSLILYAKTQKIKDAYNMVLISNSCIDILLAILFYLPQLAIVNVIILGIFAYLFGIFWYLTNPVFIFMCCMAIAINMVITGDYFAQIDYENVARDENN